MQTRLARAPCEDVLHGLRDGVHLMNDVMNTLELAKDRMALLELCTTVDDMRFATPGKPVTVSLRCADFDVASSDLLVVTIPPIETKPDSPPATDRQLPVADTPAHRPVRATRASPRLSAVRPGKRALPPTPATTSVSSKQAEPKLPRGAEQSARRRRLPDF